MVHICKTIPSPGVFFILSKFWLSKSWEGYNGKKMAHNDKNYVRCTPYLRNHTSYDLQKLAQNDQKCYLSHSVFQEPCIVWSQFFVCKVMISWANFFTFSKFWFWGFLSGLKGKKWSNIANFNLSRSIPQEL